MSQENVEIVQQMWECFVGDNPVSGLSFCDPDIEWDGTNLPDGTVARGHEAIVEHTLRWAEMWDDWRMEPERFIDAGDDQVVLVFREIGRSDSGPSHGRTPRRAVQTARPQGRLSEGLFRSCRGPRSRGAVGVGRSLGRLPTRCDVAPSVTPLAVG